MKVSKKETQLTASDRLPYEKFLQKGAESLSDAELLAILQPAAADQGNRRSKSRADLLHF